MMEIKLTYEEWIAENNQDIEDLYQVLKDEYGDAMNCLLSEYKQQKFREYLAENITY